MKRKLLVAASFITLTVAGFGQCTPDPLYADSTFGLWPDTIENLPCADVNQLYNTVIDLKIPTDASQIPADPPNPPAPINWIRMDSIEGLSATGLNLSPAGNTPNSLWNSGEQGCVLLSGTPTVVGTYSLTVHATAELDLGLPTPIEQSQQFGGYRIDVMNPCVTGIDVYSTQKLMLLQNVPNPFQENTAITFKTSKVGMVDLNIINLLGEIVHVEEFAAETGVNEILFHNKSLPSGIYTYSLRMGDTTVSKRMVIAE